MAKTKNPRVARTHDNGTRTKAEFFGLFRSAIRKIWMYSAIRREAIKRAKVAPNQYLCANCNERFKSNEIDVNHKNGCGSLREFDDFTPFISAMFSENIDGLEILCKPCHKVFTKENR